MCINTKLHKINCEKLVEDLLRRDGKLFMYVCLAKTIAKSIRLGCHLQDYVCGIH